MSGKRTNPLEDPPNASSSDEDEVENSIGEGNSSSEEEEEDDDDVSSRNPTVTKPETEEKKKNQVPDSESGSEEETDSESETEKKVPVKKQVPSVVKNHDSKKVESSARSASKKRPSETDGPEAKRVKRVSGEEDKKTGGEETKKTYFQRVWSEEDEIAVLQGIIDYKADTGESPEDDKNAFYELVKKSISFDVSKIQFMEKFRNLRKKFVKNSLGKGKKGEDPAFSKPHDRKAFDLSKLVWGANGVMALESAVVKSNGKKPKTSTKVEVVSSSPPNGDEVKRELSSRRTEETESVLVKPLARFGVDDLAAQQGWSRLGSEDKKRFEEQWKELQLREFKFYSEKSGFIHQVVTKMAESFQPNP